MLQWRDRRNDHEVELGIVIGEGGRNISRENALNHVAGYAIALDMVVRGPEDRSFRKSADTYSVLGPWLVTADEIPIRFPGVRYRSGMARRGSAPIRRISFAIAVI